MTDPRKVEGTRPTAGPRTQEISGKIESTATPTTPSEPGREPLVGFRDMKSGPRYFLVNKTPEEQDSYNLTAHRNLEKPSGPIVSIAQLVKGALGAGILSSHVAYKAAGLYPALILNLLLGIYMSYSLYTLGTCAKRCYKRCAVPTLSYPDVAEACFAISSSSIIRKMSRYVRYWIDFCLGLELFGACTCYQLMVANTIKQLVEDRSQTTIKGLPGYPNLRIYLVALMIPFLIISLIRHLQWLAPFSIIGNFLVLICIITTIIYSIKENPSFQGMTPVTDFKGAFTFVGVIVFSMSCVGVVLPVENNLRKPEQFRAVFLTGMAIIVMSVETTAFFGYNAYRDQSKAPITLNFPMELLPKILKGLIALNIYLTHGINFWVPFNLVYNYIQKFHKPERKIFFEYVYRTIFCIACSLIGLAFPDVPKVMSFIGCFCLSNLAFIFPTVMDLVLVWDRPGLGMLKWRLIRAIVSLLLGVFIFIAGTFTSIGDILSLFGVEFKM